MKPLTGSSSSSTVAVMTAALLELIKHAVTFFPAFVNTVDTNSPNKPESLTLDVAC
jgi:hypothetical protein